MFGDSPYDVVVGTGILGELPGLVGEKARTVAVIHPVTLPELAGPVVGVLEKAGYDVVAIPVPDAEAAKDVHVLSSLWSAFGRHGMTRTDVVVGVGGGATTDLAGFAAATWLRGVRVVQVPTTLLGMVDAAVGGKTGLNTPEGKNLVGSFHPPAGVLCDLATLVGVPRDDYVAGLAETIKGGFIADPEILRLDRGRPRGRPPPRRPPHARADRAQDPDQGRRRRRRPQRGRPARDPQLRPHPGPRHRAGRELHDPPRRGRLDRPRLRRRAGPPGRAGPTWWSGPGRS